MPAPTAKQPTDRRLPARIKARTLERRRQVRGLLLLALAILLFSILRAGPHNIFTPPGWWRLW